MIYSDLISKKRVEKVIFQSLFSTAVPEHPYLVIGRLFGTVFVCAYQSHSRVDHGPV